MKTTTQARTMTVQFAPASHKKKEAHVLLMKTIHAKRMEHHTQRREER